MARRNYSYTQMLMDSMGDAEKSAMGIAQNNRAEADNRRADAANTRAEAESKAGLAHKAELTRGAKTEADTKTLDYGKMLREDGLRKSLTSAAGARDTAQAGTPTADGHAVDFQEVKKANRGFERADVSLWNALNPDKPLSGEALVAKRARDEAGEELAMEEKEFGLGEKKNKAARDAAESTAGIGETTARTKLLGAQTEKAAKEAKEGPAPKPPTADQAKVATFGRRVEQAMAEMGRLEGEGYDRSSPKAGLGAKLPNMLKSSSAQQQSQAERNFVNAVLRRESGAVISDQEFANAEKQYFPRSGDSKETLEQKARNRQQVVQGFQAEAGTAWENVAPVAAPGAAKPAATGGLDSADPKVKAALAAGYTEDEIRAFLGKRK